MPYARVADLPPAVKDNLPTHAQAIFMAAFNAAHEKGMPDVACDRVAWAAVKQAYEKDAAGAWVRKVKVAAFLAQAFNENHDAQGRFASGPGGGSSGAEPRRTGPRDQLSFDKKDESIIADAKEVGIEVSPEQAADISRAIGAYSTSAFSYIREMQMTGTVASNNAKLSQDDLARIRKYADDIEFATTFLPRTSGNIYRGIAMKNSAALALKPGAEIDMRGVSSWTSNFTKAEGFSLGKTSAASPSTFSARVIFRVANKSAVNISHLSKIAGESESIFSSRARFRILKTSTSNNTSTGKSRTPVMVVTLEEI